MDVTGGCHKTHPIKPAHHHIIRQQSRIQFSLNCHDLRRFALPRPPTTLASRELSDRLIDNMFTVWSGSYPVPASLATPEDVIFIRHYSIMLSLLHQQSSTPETFVLQAAVTRSINPFITRNSTAQRTDNHVHAPTLRKHSLALLRVFGSHPFNSL